MKNTIFLIFLVALLISASEKVIAQSLDSDTNLERDLYAFASTRSGVSFGEPGFRLCAVPFIPGKSAVVVYWDRIDDSEIAARLGFFEAGQLVSIETNRISDLNLAISSQLYPRPTVRDEVRANRHTFETRANSIPVEWRVLLHRLKDGLANANIESREDFDCAWLLDLDVDHNASTVDALSILCRCRSHNDDYILVRPNLGITYVEVKNLTTPATPDAVVTAIISALRGMPVVPIEFLIVAPGTDVTWAAIDANTNPNISFCLGTSRANRLSALCNGIAPVTIPWVNIQSKLSDLRNKQILRTSVDEREFTRWLITETGPSALRPIDPAVLLLQWSG